MRWLASVPSATVAILTAVLLATSACAPDPRAGAQRPGRIAFELQNLHRVKTSTASRVYRSGGKETYRMTFTTWRSQGDIVAVGDPALASRLYVVFFNVHHVLGGDPFRSLPVYEDHVKLPRFRGQPNRRENAPGGPHGEAEAAVIHAGVQGGHGQAGA